MTTGATGQLGLALPVQGELSGTWGDTVNNGLTQYINIAIAGTLTLTGDGAVTLANTTGDASASNVTSTLAGAGTVTAQFAIVRVTGTLTVAKVVTGPSYSKTYTVVNAATGGIVTFKASGQTGVSIAVGESAFVYFNGTDYVKVSGTVAVASFQTSLGGLTPSTATTGVVTLAGTLNTTSGGTGLTTFTAGDVPYYASGSVLSKLAIGTAGQFLTSTGTAPQWSTLSGVAVTTFSAGTTGFTPSSATSGAITLAGTLATTNGGTGLTSFTSGGVVYASSSSALATGSALNFNGTNVLTVTANSAELVLSGGGSAAQGGYLQILRGGTAKILLGTASNVLGGGSNTSDDLTLFATAESRFYASSAEQMRLTSTGLGIGTSSPAFKLDVTGTGRITGELTLGNDVKQTSDAYVYSSNGGGVRAGFLLDGTNAAVRVFTAGTEKARFDSAGNLGLGVTPSAWSLLKAFQIGNTSLASYSGTGYLMTNAYFDGSVYRYTSSNYANLYTQNNSVGQHAWNVAASGTAGDTISFTQAMALDASGRLGIGETSPAQTLVLKNTSSAPYLSFIAGASSAMGVLMGTAANTVDGQIVYSNSTQALTFVTASAERMRIDSAGNVGIGTSSPAAKLDVVGAETSGIVNVARLRNPVNSAGTGHGASLILHSTTDAGRGVAIASSSTANFAVDNAMLFYTSASSTLTEKMRITSAGDVGIGTSSPQSLLALRTGGTSPVNGGVGLTISHNSNVIANGTDLVFGGVTIQRDKSSALADGDSLGGINWGKLIAGELRNSVAAIGALQSGTGESAHLTFYTAPSGRAPVERMRITSAGNVGIGTNDPQDMLDVYANARVGQGQITSDATVGILGIYGGLSGGSTTSQLKFFGKSVSNTGLTYEIARITGSSFGPYSLDGGLQFSTASNNGSNVLTLAERARITSGGYFKAQGDSTYQDTAGLYHEFSSAQDNQAFIVASTNTGSSVVGIRSKLPSGANASAKYFISELAGTGTVFQVIANGNVQNTNNSYGAISDVKLKENIVDATPKLANLMQVKVRNYNLKISPDQKQIGVIAQELEAVFPAMVETDFEGTKSVKYSVFVPMLIKAMQEQQAIIESLKARLDAANL